VVSGIGFIGGGVIFMRRDVVRGLTTAASVWLAAALGMACGARLPVLAVATTVIHFVVMLVFPRLAAVLPKEKRLATRLRISYRDGRGLLRDILVACTQLRFAIDHVDVEGNRHTGFPTREEAEDVADLEGIEPEGVNGKGVVSLSMQVKGKRPVSHLIARLSAIDGVVHVGSQADGDELE
jgi:putative Mg2+ transporter-C (MgtC) family protein